MKADTLRLSGFNRKTLFLTFILLLCFGGIAEGVARSDFFQDRLTPPKLGSSHYQLGHKLRLLAEIIQKNGPVDCIMVGSSMVDLGFDPNAFQNSYQEITGSDIHCFNFGIDASSAISSGALAQILVEDYQPRLLIFGTDPRDYVLAQDDPDVAVVMDTPWIRYRLGDFSPDGFLTNHSYFYRYRQHLSRLLRFNLEDTLSSASDDYFRVLANGHTPIDRVSAHPSGPPDPQDDSYEVTYLNRILNPYQIFEENLDSLEEIIHHNGSDTQVIVVEMPIPDGYHYFFGNGRNDYEMFIDQVAELSEAHQVPFWRTEYLNMIPDDGWVDYSHLNTKGAKIFSAWLGEQVGKFESQK